MNDKIPSKLDILKNLGQLLILVPQQFSMVELKKNSGSLSEAISVSEDLVKNLKSILDLQKKNNEYFPDSPIENESTANMLINTLFIQADLHEATGESVHSDSIREEALSISKQYLPEEEVSDKKRQNADSLISQGRFNEALTVLSDVKQKMLKNNDIPKLAIASAKYAGLLEWLGDYRRALEEIESTEKLVQPLVDDGNTSMNAVVSTLMSGRMSKAESQVRILQILSEIESTRARLNRFLGNYSEAEAQFRKILQKTPKFVRPAVEYHLAAIAIEAGRYEDGLDNIRIQKPAFTGLLRMKYGTLLSLEAEALINLGYPKEALSTINEAIETISSFNDKDSLWKAYWRQARILTELGERSEALISYMKSADVINCLRKAPLGYRLDSLYLRDKMPVFEEAILLACEMEMVEDCCSLVEMVKSRTLTAAMSIPPIDGSKTPNDLDLGFDELSRKIDMLEYKAFQDNMWSEEIDAQRQEYLNLRTELIERIRFSDPRWRTLTEPVEFSLSECVSVLAEREQAALSLFIAGDRIITVLLKDGECKTDSLVVTNETREKISRYTANLLSMEPDIQLFDPSSGLNLDASELIPENLLKQALEASSIVIAPHGSLHLLPWAGLKYGQMRLFESCPLGIVPNLSCINPLSNPICDNPSVGLIGNPDYSSSPKLKPLDYTEEEMEKVAEFYSSEASANPPIYSGGDATEKNFRNLVTSDNLKGGIVHISCHGEFVTGEPMNSGLLMSDGKVDAAEIARSRLSVDEIVLSACSSGHRPTKVLDVELTGDDILGLPGAFLEAGVRSVLVSIPKAREDVAQRFMILYHKNRAGGLTPLHALQSAQMRMQASGMYESYLWVGFTIYGCQ